MTGVTEMTVVYPRNWATDEPPQAGDLMFLFVPPGHQWVPPPGWTQNGDMAIRWFGPHDRLPVEATIVFAWPVDIEVRFQVVRPIGMA